MNHGEENNTTHITDFDPVEDTLYLYSLSWEAPNALTATATDQGVLFQYDKAGDGHTVASVAVDTAEPVDLSGGIDGLILVGWGHFYTSIDSL